MIGRNFISPSSCAIPLVFPVIESMYPLLSVDTLSLDSCTLIPIPPECFRYTSIANPYRLRISGKK